MAVDRERLERAARVIQEKTGASDVLLFGSAAEGRLRHDSDIDLAYIAPSPPLSEERLSLHGALLKELGRPVDLVFLPTASPILSMQVLRGGQPLLGPASTAFVHFTMKTVSAYDDLKRVRASAERALLGRFATSG